MVVLYNAIFGGRSLLQADQMCRKKEIKAFIGSKRPQVASDTTMHNALQTMDGEQIRELIKLAYFRGKEKGLIRAKSIELGDIRLASMDGTGFGKFLACGFQVMGNLEMFLDIERIPKKGKELPVSRELLRRVVERFGKSFVDLLLLDSLYFSHEEINFCLKDAKIHVLIKLKESELDNLNILKDAEGMFSSPEFKPDVEYSSGIDEVRMVKYQVWAAEGFSLDGCDFPLKVAKVKGNHLKKDRDFTFWVVTTLKSLTANQMRIGGHLRWHIENNGFKELNAQTNSKHVWTHNQNEWEIITLILLLAFAALTIYESNLDKTLIRKSYGGVTITIHFVARLLYDSLSADRQG